MLSLLAESPGPAGVSEPTVDLETVDGVLRVLRRLAGEKGAATAGGLDFVAEVAGDDRRRPSILTSCLCDAGFNLLIAASGLFAF